MLLVTGGFAGSLFLDSTEVFDPSLGSWVITAKLPQPLEGLRATNINNRVLIFGIYRHHIFGSDRSSRCCNVCLSDHLAQVCLEHLELHLSPSDLQAALSALSISES